MTKSARVSHHQHFSVALGLRPGQTTDHIERELEKHGLSVLQLVEPSNFSALPGETAVVVLDANLASEHELTQLWKKHHNTQIIACGDLPVAIQRAQADNSRLWSLRSIADSEALVMLVAKACVIHELAQRTAELETVVGGGMVMPQFQYQSQAMQELMERVRQTAQRDSTVMLRGETGTGKTSIARLIHDLSARKDGPFLTLSCAALPRELLEAELFGYERGAFTGATQSRPGCAELADRGTLFLDEIGDLPFELQPKLLTFLQERWVRRLGGRDVKHPDVRIISATHRDLRRMVREGSFREDLLYRLEVLELEVPPLRERKGDIKPICNHFLAQTAQRRREKAKTLSIEAQRKLDAHSWPGNVRELQNVLERALAYADGEMINDEDLQLRATDRTDVSSHSTLAGLTLKEIERRAILETLERTHGDKVAAAKMLGISLKSIYNKLNALGS